jgi:hypothetical protein
MKYRRIACLSAVLLAILPGAFGVTAFDTWTFDGTITTGLPGSPYQAGLAYSVYFTLDTSRLTTAANGVYFPTESYGFGVNHSGFSGSSLGSGVLVANNQPASGGGSFDGIIFSMTGDQSSGFPAGSLFDGSEFGITLLNNSAGPTATPFNDTSFPSALNLNQFSQRYMSVYFQSGPVRGTVDSLFINGVLVSQTPEPGAVGLLVLGGLVFGLSAYFRNRTRAA